MSMGPWARWLPSVKVKISDSRESARTFDEVLGDDAGDISPRGKCGVGHLAHQADVAAPVHQVVAGDRE